MDARHPISLEDRFDSITLALRQAHGWLPCYTFGDMRRFLAARKAPLESDIQSAICDYLAYRKAFGAGGCYHVVRSTHNIQQGALASEDR
jgi:hypothetical protein